MRFSRLTVVATMLLASPALAQTTNDPFPDPIEANEGVVRVDYSEFATIPDVDGEPARVMSLVDEPGTGRIFVSDMRGPLYTVSYDGGTVTGYLDVNAPRWGFSVLSAGRERGVQSVALHPQFGQPGTPGYGKIYTWSDSDDVAPPPDFAPTEGDAHDTVLHEWTANDASAATYDGGAPRELARFQQPFGNHNGGQIGFNPLAEPGDPDYGMLYVGVGDGGSGGDPQNLSQDLTSGFGKIFRIDPLGSNSANGEYGIPADNPFVGEAGSGALPEIWAYGVRNPQRFAWDPQTGNMFVADVGQNTVEELSLAFPGADLGWKTWEGSYGFVDRTGVDVGNARGNPEASYPVAEYDQVDPLIQNSSAATGVYVARDNAIPALNDKVLFGDMPSGEIFYIDADNLPEGGQDSLRRVLFNDGGQAKTLLQLIQEKNSEQGREMATRADMRFGHGPDGQLFLLNKGDGVLRVIVP